MLDIGLKVIFHRPLDNGIVSFNPCYVGYRSESQRKHTTTRRVNLSFNPCYVGYRSESCYYNRIILVFINVSILVMLDIGLKDDDVHVLRIVFNHVSILVMLDIGLKENLRRVENKWLMMFQSLLCWI